MKKPFAMTLIAAALMVAGAAHAKEVTDADIANDAKTTGDVTHFGLGQQGQRYSPLDKVNVKTVKNLVPVWSFSFGGEKQRGQESQPLIHDGKMFVTASYSRLFALDAKTGKKLWKYEHRLPEGIMPCCDVINRGAALYDNLVIFATLDAQLVALNKDTGKVVWKDKIDDYAAGYSATAAPLIVKGLVITGVSGGEFGVQGRMEARDAKTGKMVWMRPTVEGHMGYKWVNGEKVENGISGTTNATWTGDLWKTGGAATWNGATYDPDTNLVFAGTGNPAPWNSHLRPGDNLFSSATVAIDPDTGKIVWHYQTTPHDGWDFDGVNEFVSFDYKDPKTGKIIKAGGKADRNGFFFVLDRTNGKPLNIFPFVKDITWATGFDMSTGRPIYVDETVRAIRPAAPMARRARASSPRRPSWVARTSSRSPTTRRPACSTCRPTSGAWTSGTSPSPTSAVRPTWAPASPSRPCTTTTSAPCAPSTRPPARSSGKTRTSLPCGAVS
jgi:alcohol dehydrogenase (cytochrome c)